MRKALLASLVALAAIGVAAVVLVRWPGNVGSYGFGIGSPLRVGTVLAVGEGGVANHSSRPLTIDRITLHDARGLTLVGALVARGNAAVGALYGWPPHSAAHFFPARGYRVPPHSEVDLVIGVSANHAGQFIDHGVDVSYHRRVVGVTLKLRDHVGAWLGVCARRTAAQPRCAPPSMPR